MPEIKTHAEWLQAQLKGIGASEASAIVGQNPYMSNVDLWRIKVGRRQAADISNKNSLGDCQAAQGPKPERFSQDYADTYSVAYGGEFDMIHNPEFPWLFATLDGRLVELSTGLPGILEIKTTEILRSMQREKWRDKIPDNYYIQILHQLLATGWDFTVLHAQLKRVWDGEIRTERRSYRINREDVQDDLDYLLEQEIAFWQMVQEGREPPLLLPEI